MSVQKYVDDPTIEDDAELWRRLNPEWVIWDENMGCHRPSTAAFDNSRDGSPTSFYLAEIVRQTDRDEDAVLAPFPGYSLASVSAGEARDCHQGVTRDPLPEEPAHALMFGPKTKSTKRCLAQKATLIRNASV